MAQEIKHYAGGQLFNQNAAVSLGKDSDYIEGVSNNIDEDHSLVLLRDSLLCMARKYPVHAQSISQLASFIDLLIRLPVVQCF